MRQDRILYLEGFRSCLIIIQTFAKYGRKKFLNIRRSSDIVVEKNVTNVDMLMDLVRGQYYKPFMPVITPLAMYFSMILTELRR
jgi:hypothetical protein